MNVSSASALSRLPLDRFKTFVARSSERAQHWSRSMFRDLRGFHFLPTNDCYLQSNSAFLNGWRFGMVASSGHQIELNDENRYAFLLPFEGRIAVARGNEELAAVPGQLLSSRPGTRRTLVGPDYRGAVILAPASELRKRAALLEPGAPLLLCDDAEELDPGSRLGSVLRRQFLHTLEELDRSDVYRKSERLALGALNLLSDLIVERWLAVRCEAQGEQQELSASRKQVDKAEEFMRAMLTEPISIGDVASHLGISARALQAAFRRHRNTTPLAFLTARRIEYVRDRLSDPQPCETVTSIMHDCGIANPGRFAAVYRQAYGEAPSATLHRTQSR